MQKAPYVFPIVGGRKVEHLMSNLEALDIVLTSEHIAYIESSLPFDRGFPYSFFVRPFPCSLWVLLIDCSDHRAPRIATSITCS